MTIATAAESKLANAALFSNSRSSAVADNADAVQNIVQVLKARVESSAGDQDLTIPHYVSFCDPTATDYANAPIGSECTVISVDSTKTPTAYTASKWILNEFGWCKAIYGGQSLTLNTTSTAGSEMNRIWGSTSATSGIFRGLSVRTNFTGAGTATGDALRVYNMTAVSIANMHGIHATAQLGAEDAASVGTVTGQAAGVRATIGIGLTNTAPAGGTLAALRCDSYFLSTAASAASSMIYMCDVGTSYGVDCILRIGALVNRSTSKNTGSYQYIAGHQTVGNCDGSLKVVTPDGTFYIPLYASFS